MSMEAFKVVKKCGPFFVKGKSIVMKCCKICVMHQKNCSDVISTTECMKGVAL